MQAKSYSHYASLQGLGGRTYAYRTSGVVTGGQRRAKCSLMHIAVLVVLLTGLAALWLPGTANADHKNNSPFKLVIASSNNFPPVNMLDKEDRLIGFGADLSDAVAKAIGADVERMHSSRWSDVLRWLDEGSVDLLHDVGITDKREAFMDFTTPILDMPEVIFTRTDTFDINDLESLKGRRVACVNGHISHLYLMTIPGMTCHMVDAPIDGIYHLISGDVDAFVYPRQIVYYKAQRLHINDKIKVSGQPLRHLKWAMGVKDGNQEMLDRLNKGIAMVRKSGEYDRIYQRWFGVHVLSGYTKRELVQFSALAASVAALAILSATLIYFNIKLTRNRRELQEAITEKDRASEDLRASEERLSHIFESANDGIVIADAETREFVIANRTFHEMFGYAQDEMLGLRLEDIHRKEDLDQLKEQFRLMVEGDLGYIGDVPSVKKDGGIIYVDIKASTIVLDGRPYLMGLFRDTSERRDVQMQFRALVEASLDAFWTASDQGRIVDANEMAWKMLGYTKEEFIGMHVSDIDAVESPEETAQHVQYTIEKGFDRFESKHRKKDGTIIDVEISAYLFTDHKGRMDLLSFIRDITDRNTMNAALRQSEESMRTLIESIPLKIFYKDLDSAYISCNQNLANDLGIDKEEIAGKTDYDFFSKDLARKYREDDRKVLASGEVVEIEETYVVKDREMTVSTVKTPVRDHEGRTIGLLGVFQDITDRKRSEKALLERQEEIEELNRSLELRVLDESAKNRQKDILIMQQGRLASMGEMIGHIAHQWRQPLNALSLIIFNLKHFFEAGELNDESVQKLTSKANNLIQKMSHTIDDFRNFFRPNKEIQVFSVNKVVHNSLSLLEASLEHNDISTSVVEDGEVLVAGFPNEYSQVILNILNNSRVAIMEGARKGHIEIKMEINDGNSLLTVRDNGGGIPADVIDRVFEPYFTTRDEGQGTGLGLYMSKVIIEEHMKGSLTANNVDGGAELIVSVPVSISEGAAGRGHGEGSHE